MKHTASLTQGNILQVLLRFSIPFLLANLLQALYGAADLMIIGAYCPAESIAAVSTGTQVTQIITSVISGLTLGATILVANMQAGSSLIKSKRRSVPRLPFCTVLYYPEPDTGLQHR